MSAIELQEAPDTLGRMAKKRKGRQQPEARSNPRVAFHLPADLLGELKEAADRNRRTMTAELILALERYLRREEGPEAD